MRPYHPAFHVHQAIPYSKCDARQALPYTMPYPQCHTVYYAMHARHCPIPRHARKAIPYTMPCIVRSCHMPCFASPDHTVYHVVPVRPFHIPCHARQTIHYIPSSGHTIYYDMPARPYLFQCHARQAIPYTIAMRRQAIT